MSGDRSSRALARIEAALERIEAATRNRAHHAALERIEAATRNRAHHAASSDELADLRSRHERLRAAVTDSLAELDQLIEVAQA